jgi:hypothetical protein
MLNWQAGSAEEAEDVDADAGALRGRVTDW